MTTGTLTNTGQQDWIAVSLTANQPVEFTIAGLSSFATVNLGTAAVFATDGIAATSAVIAQSGTASPLNLFADVTTTGTYYLDVSDPAPVSAAAPFTITAAPVTATDLPNTSTTATIAVGGTLSGSLANPGQHDWIAVSLAANQAYELTVGGLSTGAGITIGTAAALTPPVLSAVNQANTGAAAAGTAQLTFMPATAGTYYIDISDPFPLAATESFTASLVTTTVDRPNNATTTTTLSANAPVTGTLTNPGQHDWVAVSLTAGTPQELSITGLSGGATITLGTAAQLAAGQTIATAAPSNVFTTNSLAELGLYANVATTGLYYLDIADPTQPTPETYSITIGAPAGTLAPQPTLAPGATISGTLENIGQVATVAVSLAANTAYEFTILGLSQYAGITLSTAGTQGTIAAISPGGNNLALAVEQDLFFTAPAAGTYLLALSDAASTSPEEAFSVSVAGVPVDLAANATTTGSIAVGANASGTLSNLGQHDWIAASLTANQAYEITTTGLSANGTVSISPGTPATTATALPVTNIAAAGAADQNLYFMPATTGTYEIDISDPTPLTAAEGFTVTLAAVPADVSDNLANPGTITVTQPAGQVTLTGANNQLLTYQFADTVVAAAALAAVAPVNAAVEAGGTAELLIHTGGQFAVPAGITAVAIDATSPDTIFGGAANGQVVIAANAGLAYNAGSGSGAIFATGGNDLVSAYAGSGDQFIATGAGNDTIIALGGNDTVNAGAGTNEILTGSGNDVITSAGTDLIAAGAVGNATISAEANNPTIFLGPGNSVFNGGSGQATVVATAGADTLNAQGGSQLWLGTKADMVNTTGADTIIGNTGAATVNASGNSFIFAGSGKLDFINAGGAQTVLGAASGAMTLAGGAGSLVALSYGSTQYTGGSGADTIAAFGGSITVSGGAGSGLFLGGPAGHNSITGGAGQSIILGGGAGDVLQAGSGVGDVLKGASGAETISAANTTGAEKLYGGTGADLIETGQGNANVLLGSGATTLIAGGGTDLYAFTKGDANTVLIQNFSASVDYLSLIGFAAAAAATALAAATTAGGSESLTLSDGTHITFQGFTGLTTANFL